jgi:multidrug efflux pump subunit AcrB
MIFAAQIIAAVFSFFFLSVNRLPDFSFLSVTVETISPGMAANEVRMLVTIPIEDGLSPIKGLEKMRSVSRDNRSLISMDFRWGTDPMAASVLVREAIDMVYPSLPEGVRKPFVTAGDSTNEPHAIIAVNAHNGNAEFARNLAEYELRARLRRIDGVGSVILVGGEVAEEHLLLDVPRLTAFGFAPSEFAGLLAQETTDIPAGNAREGNMELIVISSGMPDSTAELAQIILPAANGTLKVEDAGILTSASARRESVFIYDGKETTALEIYRRPGSDPLRLSREIRKTINEASALFSRDAQITIVTDSTPSLVSGIKSLVFSAALGAAAVFAVLLLFIRRLKYSLLVSLSIPFSAAAGICLLSVMGKSLNSMSLSGLAMGIGLVSDISVIILDMLHRTFKKNDSFPASEKIAYKVFSISGSSFASTATTILVFAPIIFLYGPLGSLFGDIAIALVTSVLAGWLYAMFCLPSLYKKLYTTIENTKIFKMPQFTSVFSDGSLEKKYSRFLLFSLHRPKKILITAAFIVIVGTISFFFRPVVFINPDEAEEVHVSVVFPPGTLLETIGEISNVFIDSVSGLPSVKTVYGRAGAEEEDVNRRANIDYIKEEIILQCVLKKGIKPEKALAEIKTTIASLEYSYDFPFSVYLPKDKTEILLGLSAERTFVIKAKDRDELLERKETATEIFKDASVSVNFRPHGQRPELRLYPNREAAAYLSIPAAQIAETLFILNEGVVASRLEIEGRPLNVRVMGQNTGFGDSVRQLEQIPLRTPQGKTVYLDSLGRIERMEAEAALTRFDRSDVIYADIAAGKNLPKIVNETAARFSWFTSADESVFKSYKTSIMLYLVLVIILLYMTMGALFESFLLPIILMFTIPFSLAGAGPALLITGSKIDSGAIFGLVVLFGLVVNNSLVLFEISEEKIQSGLSVNTAVFRGACERLQSIVITTITTVFALFPLVLNPMGNSQKSMAATILGGVLASTLLSLFLIPPVLIKFFKWKHLRLKNLREENK